MIMKSCWYSKEYRSRLANLAAAAAPVGLAHMPLCLASSSFYPLLRRLPSKIQCHSAVSYASYETAQ